MSKVLRQFEVVTEAHRKHPEHDIELPSRATEQSAGYDFKTPISFNLQPGETRLIFTDIKAYMQPDELLYLHIRSGLGTKGVSLKNKTGLIDADYYANPDNDGNIGLCLINESKRTLFFQKGDRLVQGVFHKFLTCGESVKQDRAGGFGSTTK